MADLCKACGHRHAVPGGPCWVTDSAQVPFRNYDGLCACGTEDHRG